MVYPALLPLMRTPRLPVVDWTDVPRRFKWTHPFRRKTKCGFCACAITFQLASTNVSLGTLTLTMALFKWCKKAELRDNCSYMAVASFQALSVGLTMPEKHCPCLLLWNYASTAKLLSAAASKVQPLTLFALKLRHADPVHPQRLTANTGRKGWPHYSLKSSAIASSTNH